MRVELPETIARPYAYWTTSSLWSTRKILSSFKVDNRKYCIDLVIGSKVIASEPFQHENHEYDINAMCWRYCRSLLLKFCPWIHRTNCIRHMWKEFIKALAVKDVLRARVYVRCWTSAMSSPAVGEPEIRKQLSQGPSWTWIERCATFWATSGFGLCSLWFLMPHLPWYSFIED